MLRLADLEAPLDDVEFPDGSVHKPVPFGPTEYRLWRELQKETDSHAVGRIAMQILRACYPTATDENFDTCTSTMGLALMAHASRKIDQVRDALKNAGARQEPEDPPPAIAAKIPPTTPPSSPQTNGNTSSRRLRRKRGKTGGESTTVSPTDDPSSSGTAITTSSSTSGLQTYAASWTTSTAPSSAPTR